MNPPAMVTILGQTFADDFAIRALGAPRVLPPGKVGEEWLLWFHGRDTSFKDDVMPSSTGRIYLATSKDGISGWTMYEKPVMNPSKDDGDWFYFDSEHLGLGDVLIPGTKAQSKFATQDGVFMMYIFGGNADTQLVADKKIKGMRMEIGVAVSQDGQNWSKVEGQHPYCSILEPASTVNEFDALFVGWPTILERGAEFNMYYHSYDAQSKRYVVGLAIAKDGLKWKKIGPVFDGSAAKGRFDSKGAGARHVLRMPDDTLKMWYTGYSDTDGSTAIGTATSTDGIRWTKSSDSPVLSASDDAGAFDAAGVSQPHLIWMPDLKRWRMYYVGTGAFGADTGVGVAESEDQLGEVWQRLK